jgi:septal ring factor EnvC (AmiA/AmiB activator)
MPRPANPFTSISKKLESLKAKSEKLAQEIADLSALVAEEAGKAQTAVPAPVEKKAATKKASNQKAPAIADSTPKKRGRPAKVKTQTTSDYLSMLNADPSDTLTTPKKRGKK